MFKPGSKRILTSGAFLTTSILATPGLAVELEEITVTAERRAQSLQDVPIAVNAFTSDRIDSLQIKNFVDLGFQVPGFSINTFSKSRNNPALRGGSSSLASAGAENAVGLFIDDVYFGGAGDFEVDVFDAERIEVLRGPQGTLFGRNSTGGIISIITKDPGPEREAKVQASVGDYNLNEVRARMAGPMKDNVFGSLALSSTQRDGTSFNSVTGNRVDNLSRSSVRGKLVWAIDDTLEVKFGIAHASKDETGSARDALSASNTVDLDVLADQGFLIDGKPRVVQMQNDGRYNSEQWVGTMHVSKDMTNGLTFQSITTARNFDVNHQPENLGGIPTPIFDLADSRDLDTYTQEFRVISDSDSKLTWQGGVYLLYADETRDAHVITRWDDSVVGGVLSSAAGCPDQDPADTENFVITPVCIVNFPGLFDENEFNLVENVKTTSYSAYAQGTYAFTDQWGLTLGARYTYDEKELDGETLGEYDWTWNPSPGQTFRNKADWDEITWKAALDFKPADDILLYASASTGFRSGAYDMAQSDPQLIDQPVDPETVINYEIGFKSRLFDNRLQLNVALFDTTYEDLQFYINSVGSGGQSTTTNAGEATVEGVEVDVTWAVTANLMLTLGYSHQDGSSKDIPEAAQADVPNGTPPQGTVPNTYTAALDYTLPAGDGEWFFHADWVKRDEYTLEFIDNNIPQFRSKVDGLVNANIGYRSANGWEVQLWGKNLRDEEIVLYGQDFWFSVYGAQLGDNPELFNASFGPRYSDPRTWGVTVMYEF